MSRLRILAVAIATCVLAMARPLPAQTSAADPELARAVAAVLADSMLDGDGGRQRIVWRLYPAPLDSAVGRILASHPAFQGPVDGRTLWMGINEVTVQGDTARLVVYRGQHLGGSGFPTFWLERTAHVFERGSTGWRFIRREPPIHADGGEVRGE